MTKPQLSKPCASPEKRKESPKLKEEGDCENKSFYEATKLQRALWRSGGVKLKIHFHGEN